jgi:leucyl aminopeptidase (aminopeptidase T)
VFLTRIFEASAMDRKLLAQIAGKILTESLGVKKGETVTVETWNTGLGLAREVVRQARRMGAIPVMIFEDERTFIDGVKGAPREMLGKMGKHEYGLLGATDAYVFIPGPPLGVYYRKVTRDQYAKATQYNSSWYQAAEKARLRGVRVSFGYVGKDLAGYLGKDADKIASAQLSAALSNFRKMKTKGVALSRKLSDQSTAILTTSAGELKFRLKGGLEIEDGLVDKNDLATGQNVAYIPPGLVSKEVVPTSARGKVKLSPSLTRLGVVDDLTLTFNGGQLTGWSPGRPAGVVDEVLASIKESNRRISLVTVGLNPKLSFGNALDRFVLGAIGISGFGFTGIVRKGTLAVGESKLVVNGTL